MAQDSDIKLLGVQELKQLYRLPDVQVVDVRLPFDFYGGRVPGSVSVPGVSVATCVGTIPASSKLVIVADDNKAGALAARVALQAGYIDVSVLDGGIDAWFDADMPTETISDGIPSPLSNRDQAGQ
ncbi:MAG: rhodanese-like domain-containing protein [Rhodobiaceae bacterium]|nr:rhodanese-like domain-containing protein [Rhodobiaceae bacterium]